MKIATRIMEWKLPTPAARCVWTDAAGETCYLPKDASNHEMDYCEEGVGCSLLECHPYTTDRVRTYWANEEIL